MSTIKNYIYNMSYKILALLTPLITAPYLARIIGSEGVGVYSYTYAIAYNFMLVAKLGLTNYGSRSVARVRENKEDLSQVFSEIYAMQLMTTALACIAYVCFVLCFTDSYRAIYFINLIHVVGIAFDIDWLFYGLEQFKMIALRNSAIKLLTVVAILVFVNSADDLWIYVLIMALSDILGFVLIWVSFHKCTHFTSVKISNVLKRIKPSVVLFIPVIATSIYRSMDKIMLGSMSTMHETGIYEYSEKIVYMLLGFITSLEMIMMPKMSNLMMKHDDEKVKNNIYNSMLFVVALASAMAFGITGVASKFIPWFYGEEFLDCIKLLPPLAFTMLFIGWANVFRTQYIMPSGKDRLYVYSTLLGAVVNLVINSICIPRLAAMGAVVGTIAAEFSVALYMSIVVRKELPVRKYLANCVFFIFAGALMCLVVYLIGTLISNLLLSMIVQIIGGAALYIGICAIYVYKTQPSLYNLLRRKLVRK